ncbi:uncharacterized protein CTHT_0064360 [Thermochaetoides thermophila DSM 1495]|uniref:Uncharacterized protein n=1 Tax=Chaetomium thermophilum (strain DSM 1495 / CBS 144.50 / IMI 039719) TaxID=759272 RepID=G0SEN3_CHATD|nr:hypothetical protein CTHT_0064360 [Thermochaetoides thermophila DSM 1495]EGS18410.1 hypothetical protein CTHT_0064360 [Thermochaetoides thermophila DSM 1495]
MDDQFGGRTDDDLFADDIEPVDEALAVPVVISDTPSPAPAVTPARDAQTNEQTEKQAAMAQEEKPAAPAKSLAHSRHNPRGRGGGAEKPPRSTNHSKHNNKSHKSTHNNNTDNGNSTTDSSTTPTPSSSTPKPKRSSTGQNTSSVSSSTRLTSGANPRPKLTEAELTARIEKMRLLAAEKERRFEQAQRDESEHQAAIAKSIEEDLKRRKAAEERRKREEEERKRLEEERERNRERKLRVLKERGGWTGESHDEPDRGFRSAAGGVKGYKGMGASRFAAESNDQEDGDSFGRGGMSGRGRGGRGRGGGRGGRTLFEAYPEREREREERRHWRDRGQTQCESAADQKMDQKDKNPELKPEDFPALPSTSGVPKKLEVTWPAKPSPGKATSMADIPLSPPVGKWDDEVAAAAEVYSGT